MSQIHRKFIIFVRHPESAKNVVPTFSSSDGVESLSLLGGQQTVELQNGIQKFAAAAGVAPNDTLIVTSPALRTSVVAHGLSKVMSAELCIEDRLRPIDSGRMSGMPESHAWVEAPGFMRMLELYRAGVVSSHKIGEYGEGLSAFEQRIDKMLEHILRIDKQLCIVIAHRSSITASLIRLARISLGYPSDFFGYIPLDLGHLSAIQVGISNIVWLAVNQRPDEVCQRLVLHLAEMPTHERPV